MNSSFSKNVKYYRKKCGLNQQELALKSGISLSAYQTYERGDRSPTIETVKAIATALNVDIFRLLGPTQMTAEFTNQVSDPIKLTQGVLELKAKMYDLIFELDGNDNSEEHENALKLIARYRMANPAGRSLILQIAESICLTHPNEEE